MMLILYGIRSILIRIKGIKAISRDVWIGDPAHTHRADSACSAYLLVASCLNVQPVGPRTELCNNSSQMPVVALLYVWLASISNHISIGGSSTGSATAELCYVSRLC